MDFLGYFGIDEYVCFPLQASNTSGSAADIDSGSWSINFYEKNPADANAPAAMTTPDTTFNTKLDTKTGLYYVVVQITAANGFEATKQYFARVTGLVDGENPAALYGFYVLASPLRTYLANLDAAITSRSDFDEALDEVITDAASRTASKADVSNLDAAISSRSTFDSTSDEVDIGKVKGVGVAGVADFKADVSGIIVSVAAIKVVTDKLATIDGLDPNTALEIILAFAAGRFTKLANAFTFYKRDNVTPLYTLTISALTGYRTRT